MNRVHHGAQFLLDTLVYRQQVQLTQGAPLAQGHAHFSSECDFMMGLGKPQLHVKFEVADFIHYGNIRKFVFK